MEEVIAGIFEEYLLFHENLYQKVQRIDITKNIKDSKIGILKREKEMTQNLLSSLYFDLEEKIISKEEYQMFRGNYLEKITKLNENIEYRRKKQESVKERIKNNEMWLFDLKKYKALTKLDRLSVVMLIDKILIGENKEIEVVFNHQEEVGFLEAIANDKTENNVKCAGGKKNHKFLLEDNKWQIPLTLVEGVAQKRAESEVCYG